MPSTPRLPVPSRPRGRAPQPPRPQPLPWWKALLSMALGAAAAVGLALAVAPSTARAATIVIACGSGGSDLKFCKQHADEWARKTGHTVRTYSPPNSVTEALALYRQLFAAKSGDIDIIQIDIVWPGILKDHLLDLKPYSQGAEAEHFPAIVANNTVNGRLVGMPWYTDAGLLYYRKDLLAKHGLKPPVTWAELEAAALKVQAAERAAGVRDFQGFVFQAKAAETLTCNALEWVASFGGGTLVDAQGRITVNNPQAARALDTVSRFVGRIAPAGVLNYAEEDARGVFQNGKALFMRNWPYAWALAQQPDSLIRDKVGVSALPRGDGPGAAHVGTLGGWQLSVNRYSRNAEAAASLVMHMTSAQVQKERAIQGAFNPTRPALYRDAEVIRANPFMGELLETFSTAVARPSGATGLKYPAVSLAFWDAAHDVLVGKLSGEAAVRRLEGKLTLVRRQDW